MKATAGAVIVLFFSLGGRFRTSSHAEDHIDDPQLERGKRGTDMQAEGASPSFGFAIPSPPFQNSRSDRSWPFIPRPPPVQNQPRSVFGSQASYPPRKEEQYSILDFRLNPYTNKRDNYYPQPPRRFGPKNGYHAFDEGNERFRHNVRGHSQQGFRSPVGPTPTEYSLYQEPSTILQAPKEEEPIRQYNVGPQLQEDKGSSDFDPHFEAERRPVDSRDEYDEINPWSRDESHINPTDNPRREIVIEEQNKGNADHQQKEAVDEKSVESNNSQPKITTQEEKSPPVTRPKNLAELLAKTSSIGSKTPLANNNRGSQPERKEKPRFPILRDRLNLSRSRTSVPDHFQLPATEPSDQYYDELYDEFVDMYYDQDEKSTEKSAGASKASDGNKDDSETEKKLGSSVVENSHPTTEASPPTSTEKTPLLSSTPRSRRVFPTLRPRSRPSKATPPKDAVEEKTISTLPPTTTTTTAGITSTSRSITNAPISLSEILQELSLSLPQFLATLKTHGTSLKEFTNKLQTKYLSKSELSRAKGNVKKLLGILDSSPDKSTKSQNSSSPTTKGTTQTTTLTTPKNPTTSPKLEIKTSDEAKPKTKSVKPRVFGSLQSGISFTKNKTAANLNGKDNKSNSSSRPTVAIKLDIAKIVHEKGISPADILQDFNKMFNISDSILTTESPESNKKTTVSLRPYRKSAERYRPYKPLSHEGGNRNIHRGIISSRLSSTSRPTLRPPYSPRPPSINYVDTEESSHLEAPPDQTDTTEENTSKTDKSSSDTKKKKRYEDIFKLNIGQTSAENLDVSTRSAIMAAGILGGVALSVFIAIFIVVKYKNHVHRNRRRIPLTLPSDSSSSSLPPIYATRSVLGKEAYQTSGFWTTLKKRFDPYSTSSSPTSM